MKTNNLGLIIILLIVTFSNSSNIKYEIIKKYQNCDVVQNYSCYRNFIVWKGLSSKELFLCKKGIKTSLFKDSLDIFDYHIKDDTLVCLLAKKTSEGVLFKGIKSMMTNGKKIAVYEHKLPIWSSSPPILTNNDDVLMSLDKGFVITALFSDSIFIQCRDQIFFESRVSKDYSNKYYYCTGSTSNDGPCFITFVDTIITKIPLKQIISKINQAVLSYHIEIIQDNAIVLETYSNQTKLFYYPSWKTSKIISNQLYSYPSKGSFSGISEDTVFIDYQNSFHKICLPKKQD